MAEGNGAAKLRNLDILASVAFVLMLVLLAGILGAAYPGAFFLECRFFNRFIIFTFF